MAEQIVRVNPDIEKTELFGIPLQELPTYRKAEPVKDKPVEPHVGVNYPLLDEILAFIIEHPRQWEQAAWFRIVDRETGEMKYNIEVQTVEEVNSCGAAFCFAGHVALAAGFPSPPIDNHQEWSRTVILDPEAEYRWDRAYDESVDEFAYKVLGITAGQADALFAGENRISDLKAIVKALHLDPDVRGYDLREMIEELSDADEDVDYSDQVEDWMKEHGYLTPDAA